jgi:MoaD family protein
MKSATAITIHVPSQLRDRCEGARLLELSAADVRAALDEIERDHPNLYRGICDETGAVRRHINIFVNTENTRDLEGLATPLAPGDEVMILPAVSGG